MIYSKQEFARLAQAIHRLILEQQHQIKLGSLRECLASAMGKNSCAHLLSELPAPVPEDFVTTLATLLTDRHRVDWNLPVWEIPWPREMVFEDVELGKIWRAACYSKGYTPMWATPTLYPDGQGGWIVPKGEHSSCYLEQCKEVLGAVVEGDPPSFDVDLISDDTCRELASALKPLAFAYWNQEMTHLPRRLLAEFADSDLATASGELFTLDGALHLSAKDLESEGFVSVGRNPAQANMVPSPWVPESFEWKKQSVPFKGTVAQKLYSGLIGHCIFNSISPEGLSQQTFDYPRDFWSKLYEIQATPAWSGYDAKHKRYNYYSSFFWQRDAFVQAIIRLAYQWLDQQSDWTQSVGEVLSRGLSDSVEEIGHVRGFGDCCDPETDTRYPLEYGKVLDYSIGYYRADAYPFYEAHEDEYIEMGVMSKDEDTADSDDDEDEWYEEPDRWNIPCFFPFYIAYGSGYVRDKPGGKALGHVLFDFLGAPGWVLATRYGEGMYEMSSEFASVAHFFQENMSDAEECSSVVLLQGFALSKDATYDQLIDSLLFMVGELNDGDADIQVVVRPSILRYRFASLVFRSAPTLKQELDREKERLVQAFNNRGIRADWLEDSRKFA